MARAAIAVATAVMLVMAVLAAVALGGDERETTATGPTSASTSTSTSESVPLGVTVSPIDLASPVVTVPPPAPPSPRSASASTTMIDPQPFAGEFTGGRRLTFLRSRRLVAVDLDIGRVTEVPIDAGEVARRWLVGEAMVQSGDDIFFIGDGHLYAIDAALRAGAPDRRTPHDALTLYRSTTASRVWVLQRAGAEFRMIEVDGAGTVVRGPVTLPVDWAPYAAVDDRAFVLGRSGELAVWDLDTGRFVWQVDDASLLAAAGGQVLWQRFCDAPVCVLHATNPRTGADRTYEPIPGALAFGPGRGAIDPTGRRLATISFDDDGRDEGSPSMVVLDLRTGARMSTNALQDGSPVWSRSGEWVFLAGGGGDSYDVVSAFRIDGDALRLVTLDMPPGAGGSAVIVQ